MLLPVTFNDINCTWSKPSLDGVGSVVVINGELESSFLSTVKKKLEEPVNYEI